MTINYPKFLLISDIDGTLTKKHSSWQVVMEELGLWESIGKNNLDAFLSNKITYDEFIALDVEAWRNLPAKTYLDIISKIPLQDGLLEMLKSIKQLGGVLILLSSGLMDLALRISNLGVPIDKIYANKIEIQNGMLTGHYEKVVGWNDKGLILNRIISEYSKYKLPVVTLGDSSGDIPLFQNSDLSFACFTLNSAIISAADFQINHLSEVSIKIKNFLTENLTN